MIENKTYDDSSALDRTIKLNEDLGLTPKRKRMCVVARGMYGVYEDYYEMKKDMDECGLTYENVYEEPKNNTYKALQHCYSQFYKKYGRHYRMVPITQGNTLYRMKYIGKLFTHVQ